MNRALIKLIQEYLIKKEPMLKKYIEYFKKAGTNTSNSREISPELRTILLDDIAKDIKRKNFGHYQLTVSEHPKKYHDNRSDYLMYEEYNPKYIEERLNNIGGDYYGDVFKKLFYKPKPTENPVSFASESDLYEAIGDAYLKVKSNDINDLKLLSNNLNKNYQEDSMDEIFNNIITDHSSIINNQLIKDGDDYTNSLKNLLYKQQKSKLLDKNYVDSYGEEIVDSPVKQYNDREKLLYELNDMDKPKTIINHIDDISIFKDHKNKFRHTINKTTKEEEILKLLEDNYYNNPNENLDDILDLRNLIKFIKEY